MDLEPTDIKPGLACCREVIASIYPSWYFGKFLIKIIKIRELGKLFIYPKNKVCLTECVLVCTSLVQLTILFISKCVLYFWHTRYWNQNFKHEKHLFYLWDKSTTLQNCTCILIIFARPLLEWENGWGSSETRFTQNSILSQDIECSLFSW